MVFRGEHLGMVGVEAEGASVGLLSPEAEEAIDLGVAVGATDPFGRGSPGELGRLRRIYESGPCVEQRLYVDSIVDRGVGRRHVIPPDVDDGWLIGGRLRSGSRTLGRLTSYERMSALARATRERRQAHMSRPADPPLAAVRFSDEEAPVTGPLSSIRAEGQVEQNPDH
jgi:hypothetical protein